MRKPFAITLDPGSSLANHTGSWRTSRPEYLDRLPPCNNACPAGENIQAWLFHAESGDYEAAWRCLRDIFGEGRMPRAVNFITGPSRTADIEQTLFLGAHGPRRLHVIVVGEAG